MDFLPTPTPMRIAQVEFESTQFGNRYFTVLFFIFQSVRRTSDCDAPSPAFIIYYRHRYIPAAINVYTAASTAFTVNMPSSSEREAIHSHAKQVQLLEFVIVIPCYGKLFTLIKHIICPGCPARPRLLLCSCIAT